MEILPGLVVDSPERIYTLVAPSPAPDGSLTVPLPVHMQAEFSTVRAKQDTAKAALSILGLLGLYERP
jgi:hypothetical protein